MVLKTMGMTTEDIKEIVKSARLAGHDIRVKDISYAIVRQTVEDAVTTYRSIYDASAEEKEVRAFENKSAMKYLWKAVRKYTEAGKPAPEQAKKNPASKYKDITFEENKEALIELLDEIQELKGTEDLSVRDAVKLETEIRTRLNDKFAVSDKKEEHRIVVNSKYNSICPYCRREVRIKTDEDMLAEIREKFILTPKQ